MSCSHECESPRLINPLSGRLIQILCLIPKSFKGSRCEGGQQCRSTASKRYFSNLKTTRLLVTVQIPPLPFAEPFHGHFEEYHARKVLETSRVGRKNALCGLGMDGNRFAGCSEHAPALGQYSSLSRSSGHLTHAS